MKSIRVRIPCTDIETLDKINKLQHELEELGVEFDGTGMDLMRGFREWFIEEVET